MDIIRYKKEALAAVKKDGRNLQYVCPRLRNDVDVVLAALEKNHYAVEFVGEKLLDDAEFLLDLIDADTGSFDISADAVVPYASERLRGDKEFALVAVYRDARAIAHLSEDLRSDEEVVELLAQVSTYHNGLMELLPEKVRGDFDTMLKFVKASGLNLEYVSTELKDNDLLVKAAVGENCYALSCASERLKYTKEIMAAALAGLLSEPEERVLSVFSGW